MQHSHVASIGAYRGGAHAPQDLADLRQLETVAGYPSVLQDQGAVFERELQAGCCLGGQVSSHAICRAGNVLAHVVLPSRPLIVRDAVSSRPCEQGSGAEWLKVS